MKALAPPCCAGESVAEEMQGRAQEAGLFQSAAACLEACQGLVSSAVWKLPVCASCLPGLCGCRNGHKGGGAGARGGASQCTAVSTETCQVLVGCCALNCASSQHNVRAAVVTAFGRQ
eukprot:scaffold242263_cov18-Tisochrysis_lutea.AAC.1